ncbi:MAG: isoleucine--tRNA ligase [Chloroflexi bacterium]|nr:isoleucine--tRNA ligase [Chloroflexota bacterium]
MEYRKTLNLPQTDFPMKANLPSREPEMLTIWREYDVYKKVQDKTRNSPVFILHDGPPYSNGPIHLGQALNKILKDIIVKYHNLVGHYSPYIPGWDTHGLPNEMQTIKTFKINRKEIEPLELREKCAESALHFVEVQKDQFIRLGITGDWEHPYLTLHHSYEAAIIKVFRIMVEKGMVYRGKRPIYWCSHCETALAEAEIEYHDKTSPSIYVKFDADEDLKEFAKEKFGYDKDFSALIWTTTPWTLPGNLAIALHPEAEYVLVETEKGALIIAEPLLAEVFKNIGVSDYKIIGKFKGAEVERLNALHPFLPRKSLLITQNYVTMDPETGGTGLVHTAPGHGAEDFYAGQQYDLPVLVPVDDMGRMTEEAGEFKGLKYTEANDAIIDHLKKTGHLLGLGDKFHSYPHCWRCRKPVIFRATEQSFVSMEEGGLRKAALEAIKDVQWVPAWGEDRFRGMLETRPDWCISRQRIWGVPIPTFVCKDCGKTILDPAAIKAIEERFRKEGSNSWFMYSAKELLPGGYACPHCSGSDIEKGSDIFDVWFESGSSQEAVCAVREELRWPPDLYLEGSDQHRGWFQLSLLPAVAVRGKAPYHTVLTHGWVLDEKGKTMHKSLGNVIDPMDLVNQFGADILRLYLSSLDYTSDIRVYPDGVKHTSEVYRKIRNTARFLLGNLYDFNPAEDFVPFDAMLEYDRWALSRTREVIDKIKSAYSSYNFHLVYTLTHNLCIIDLSSLYLDPLKDRLYTAPAGSPERRSAQTAIYHIVSALAVVLFPIVSFTAEEIWQEIPGRKEETISVHLADWPGFPESLLSEEESGRWKFFLGLREAVYQEMEKKRAEKVISQPLDSKLSLYLEGGDLKVALENQDLLRTLLIVSQLDIKDLSDAPGGASDMAGEIKGKCLIEKAAGEKCSRCWITYEKLSGSAEHPELCPRCLDVVEAAVVK